MNKLFFIALLFMIFSCSQKDRDSEVAEKGISHDRKFDLNITDTIVVDSGDDFIMLGNNSSSPSSISGDLKYFYSYDHVRDRIDEVDLDQMQLKGRIRLEENGPNGTGARIGYISSCGNGNMLINDSDDHIKLFDPSGEKLYALQLDNKNLKGAILEGNEAISTKGVMYDEDTYYSYYHNIEGAKEPLGIAKLNVSTGQFDKTPIPELGRIKAFSVSLNQNGNKMSVGNSFYFQLVGDKILMSNSAINELFVYQVEKEAVSHVSYKSQFTPNQQIEPEKKRTKDLEEFNTLYLEMLNSVSFQKPVFDAKRQHFYRFSIASQDGKVIRVITVFDRDFKQIGENLIQDFIPNISHANDGKIHWKTAIGDELAFIRGEVAEKR
ncbi:DUF4221 domain-containing protein [Echinicola soli]|uniref:DUF4221 domain-containing protein n=1 Tax=Echinicola soli TaxID=2591634 RepID=A0A514CEX5_9BACT|nr:DUF4221 family protein [Echinicola soli]QDH78395.1 DUF4221 domain-containing protein [Echinicola soli]